MSGRTKILLEPLWGDEFLANPRDWPNKSPAFAQPLKETHIPSNWNLIHTGNIDSQIKVNIYLDGRITRVIYFF
ncbi:hypothetical protein GCK72_012335 [Caenorhabditis remanei]|uniref:Uncharacterized protein n=1 Tax=Caenorhabditis remanei TaxID=31234 RepID=A0A6A5GMW7_CAERE|nr:hypothetical protein GCK72_012335 [Caenorhabditis remanei]KAF1755882.1 hypothetical protein GCK72_012335 [Caenorhabditis remanei]